MNEQALQRLDTSHFADRLPFPWLASQAVLTSEGFANLLASFPTVDLFEEHRGIERANGQRPHDRYYLAYERSIYRQTTDGSAVPGIQPLHAPEVQSEGQALVAKAREPGIVHIEDLPVPWQLFLEELQTSAVYRAFVERLLGAGPYDVRFAWHLGFNGSEVSPHRDTDKKVGTHIFYFNTSTDWRPEWGGNMMVLGDKRIRQDNPNIDDFGDVTPVDIRDNQSFFFKNTKKAWHAVGRLSPPPGHHRRLFNVIFERQTTAGQKPVKAPPLARLRQLLQRNA